jgi:hypothetical protein
VIAKRIGAASIVAAISIFSSSAQVGTERQSHNLPVYWSPKLNLGKLEEIDARLLRPVEDPVPLKKGNRSASFANCKDGLNHLDEGYRAGTDRDLRRLQALVADCRALDLLKSARPARRSAIGSNPLDPRFLPAVMAFLPSREEAQKAKATPGLSWSRFQPGVKVEENSQDTATATGADGFVRLQIYARADFNGDGVEDLLVRTDSYPRAGTYVNTRLFLLSRSAPTQVLRVLREYK